MSQKERIMQQYQQLLDNFSNLLRSARLPDEAGEAGARQQGRVPGELMEIFAEKVLQACHALLGVVAELKRNALLNDVAARNAEVASSAAAAGTEAAQLEQQLQQLQRRIDAAMQLVLPLGLDAYQQPPPQPQPQPPQQDGWLSEAEQQQAVVPMEA